MRGQSTIAILALVSPTLADIAHAFDPVAITNDGKLVASAYDIPVVVWDTATGKRRYLLEGEINCSVYEMDFSRDGSLLALRYSAGVSDEQVTIWNTRTGKQVLSLEAPLGNCFSLSPDNKILADAGGVEGIGLYEVATGKKLRAFAEHHIGFESLAFSPDGKMLASAGMFGTISIWNPANGNLRFHLIGHGDTVRSLSFSADGKKLASASEDQTIRVWDLGSARELVTLKTSAGRYSKTQLSAEGKTVAGVAGTRTLCRWDAATGKELSRWQTKARDDLVWLVAFAADGRRAVLLAPQSRHLRLIDLAKRKKR